MTDARIILGFDVGGAHLKLARLGPDGALQAVRVVACPLWKGLDQLDSALDALAAETPPDARCAVTMTGELVDLWSSRAEGVAVIANTMARRFGRDRSAFYAGAEGFVGISKVGMHADAIASANWRATAQVLALGGDAGLLVDVGSTTCDLAPFSGGSVAARGTTDASRMAAGELVYLGVARTPVMAMAPRLPFAGAWVAPMAEFFATSADVFRLTGDLPDGADLHPAADGGDKTVEASARRLLRMVGADLDAGALPAAVRIARFLAEAQLRRLHDAALGLLSRPEAGDVESIVGAGVGRFLAKRLAERLGLGYRDISTAFSSDPKLRDAAADCAPAVAVAHLVRARERGGGTQDEFGNQ